MNQPYSPLILVADDHPNTTTLMQYVFEREGFRVEKATNGADALQIAQEKHPDLILLDIMMPLLNGFDVLQMLREDPRTAKIPTIIITANAKEPTDVARGLSLGADDFLIKPIQPTELVARVTTKIKARQLEDALQQRTLALEALVQAAEQFNQHLELTELPDVIVEMMPRILPADTVVLLSLDSDGSKLAARLNGERTDIGVALIDDEPCLAASLKMPEPIFKFPADVLGDQYRDGMGAVLRQGDNLVAVVYVLSRTTPYDDNHYRLFTGIARQAALALNNARLFAVQANYAQHLEDMVNERTQALQSAQRMVVRNEKLASVGILAASIAHEIGNSVQPIKTLFDDLAEELSEQKATYDERGLEIIRENIDRVAHTIDLMRDFASNRPNAADLSPLQLSQLLTDILELNHKLLQHHRVRVQTTLPLVPLVYGSRSQLQSVFMNLILNAVAAMDSEGGTLTITARQDGDMVEVEVGDTGHGIPTENLDRIFDPFFTTKPNGTGLGLAVSYGIIKSHQGTIEAKSEVGFGSRFFVRLPISADHD